MCEVVQLAYARLRARLAPAPLRFRRVTQGEVVQFPGYLRAAQIAGQRCHHYEYSLTTTQQLQRDTIRWMQMTGVSAYEAAHRIVRGPREPYFGDAA